MDTDKTNLLTKGVFLMRLKRISIWVLSIALVLSFMPDPIMTVFADSEEIPTTWDHVNSEVLLSGENDGSEGVQIEKVTMHITEPVIGQTPVSTGTVSTVPAAALNQEAATIQLVWFKFSNSQNPMAPGETFQAGEAYACYVTSSLNDCFNSGYVPGDNTALFVNDNEIIPVMPYIIYPPLGSTVVKTLSLDVTEPKVGEKPVTKGKLSTVPAEALKAGYSDVEVTWFESDTGTIDSPRVEMSTETFQEGKYYMPSPNMKPSPPTPDYPFTPEYLNEGYTISPTLTGQAVNGTILSMRNPGFFGPLTVPEPQPETEDTPTAPAAPSPGTDPDQNGSDGTPVGPGASAAAAEKAITNMVSDEDPQGTVFGKLALKSSKQGKTSIDLSWNAVPGASSYVIYGNKCGKGVKPVKIASVNGNRQTVSAVNSQALKKGTYYKFIVVALDKNNKVVSTSRVVHAATKGGKVGNHKKVTVSKSVIKKAKKLKKGKSLKLKAKAVPQSKKLKVKKHVAVRYESTDVNIATVSKKGVVKAKNKGTCYVYAYAQNGISKRVKVTVK